jgi:hypothetical protein
LNELSLVLNQSNSQTQRAGKYTKMPFLQSQQQSVSRVGSHMGFYVTWESLASGSEEGDLPSLLMDLALLGNVTQ